MMAVKKLEFGPDMQKLEFGPEMRLLRYMTQQQEAPTPPSPKTILLPCFPVTVEYIGIKIKNNTDYIYKWCFFLI